MPKLPKASDPPVREGLGGLLLRRGGVVTKGLVAGSLKPRRGDGRKGVPRGFPTLGGLAAGSGGEGDPFRRVAYRWCFGLHQSC